MRNLLVSGLALLLVGTFAFAAESPLRGPEDTRQALYGLMDHFEAMASGRPDVSLHAERVRRALDTMTPAQLEVLHRAYADSPSVQAALGFDGDLRNDRDLRGLNVALPRVDPVYSAECGSDRADAATAQMQLDTWEQMATAAAGAQGDCDAAAEADAPTVCPVAVMAHEAAIVARFVYENTLLCNRDIDSAELGAVLGTVGDLETGLGDLADLPMAIEELEMNVLGAISDHDTAIADALAAHDQSVADALAAHDQAVGAAIAAHDAEIKAMLGAVMDGQQEILQRLSAIQQLVVTPPGRRPGWNNRPNDPADPGDEPIDPADGPGNGNGNGP